MDAEKINKLDYTSPRHEKADRATAVAAKLKKQDCSGSNTTAAIINSSMDERQPFPECTTNKTLIAQCQNHLHAIVMATEYQQAIKEEMRKFCKLERAIAQKKNNQAERLLALVGSKSNKGIKCIKTSNDNPFWALSSIQALAGLLVNQAKSHWAITDTLGKHSSKIQIFLERHNQAMDSIRSSESSALNSHPYTHLYLPPSTSTNPHLHPHPHGKRLSMPIGLPEGNTGTVRSRSPRKNTTESCRQSFSPSCSNPSDVASSANNSGGSIQARQKWLISPPPHSPPRKKQHNNNHLPCPQACTALIEHDNGGGIGGAGGLEFIGKKGNNDAYSMNDFLSTSVLYERVRKDRMTQANRADYLQMQYDSIVAQLEDAKSVIAGIKDVGFGKHLNWTTQSKLDDLQGRIEFLENQMRQTQQERQQAISEIEDFDRQHRKEVEQVLAVFECTKNKYEQALRQSILVLQSAIASNYGNSSHDHTDNNTMNIKSWETFEGKDVICKTESLNSSLDDSKTLITEDRASDSCDDTIVEETRKENPPLSKRPTWQHYCLDASSSVDPWDMEAGEFDSTCSRAPLKKSANDNIDTPRYFSGKAAMANTTNTTTSTTPIVDSNQYYINGTRINSLYAGSGSCRSSSVDKLEDRFGCMNDNHTQLKSCNSGYNNSDEDEEEDEYADGDNNNENKKLNQNRSVSDKTNNHDAEKETRFITTGNDDHDDMFIIRSEKIHDDETMHKQVSQEKDFTNEHNKLSIASSPYNSDGLKVVYVEDKLQKKSSRKGNNSNSKKEDVEDEKGEQQKDEKEEDERIKGFINKYLKKLGQRDSINSLASGYYSQTSQHAPFWKTPENITDNQRPIEITVCKESKRSLRVCTVHPIAPSIGFENTVTSLDLDLGASAMRGTARVQSSKSTKQIVTTTCRQESRALENQTNPSPPPLDSQTNSSLQSSGSHRQMDANNKKNHDVAECGSVTTLIHPLVEILGQRSDNTLLSNDTNHHHHHQQQQQQQQQHQNNSRDDEQAYKMLKEDNDRNNVINNRRKDDEEEICQSHSRRSIGVHNFVKEEEEEEEEEKKEKTCGTNKVSTENYCEKGVYPSNKHTSLQDTDVDKDTSAALKYHKSDTKTMQQLNNNVFDDNTSNDKRPRFSTSTSFTHTEAHGAVDSILKPTNNILKSKKTKTLEDQQYDCGKNNNKQFIKSDKASSQISKATHKKISFLELVSQELDDNMQDGSSKTNAHCSGTQGLQNINHPHYQQQQQQQQQQRQEQSSDSEFDSESSTFTTSLTCSSSSNMDNNIFFPPPAYKVKGGGEGVGDRKGGLKQPGKKKEGTGKTRAWVQKCVRFNEEVQYSSGTSMGNGEPDGGGIVHMYGDDDADDDDDDDDNDDDDDEEEEEEGDRNDGGGDEDEKEEVEEEADSVSI